MTRQGCNGTRGDCRGGGGSHCSTHAIREQRRGLDLILHGCADRHILAHTVSRGSWRLDFICNAQLAWSWVHRAIGPGVSRTGCAGARADFGTVAASATAGCPAHAVQHWRDLAQTRVAAALAHAAYCVQRAAADSTANTHAVTVAAVSCGAVIVVRADSVGQSIYRRAQPPSTLC